MHSRVAALLVLAILPLMSVLAAPAPEPAHALLDIGPPPKGKTAEEHRKAEIGHLPHYYIYLLLDSEVKKLPTAASLKKGPAWLEKTLRITEEEGGRRLRLTLKAGTRAEQVVILNALLREYCRLTVTERIPKLEKAIRDSEAGAPRLAKLLKEERDPDKLKRYQKEWEDARTGNADLRAEIARLKKVTIIKWAK